MKAMRFAAFGGLESLRTVDLPNPQPRPGELAVDVAAIAVNPVDWKLHSGVLRWLSPLRVSAIPCFDFSGTIAESSVGPFRPGDRVFGLCRIGRSGSACERLIAKPEELVGIPPAIGFEEAAGVPLAGMTALQALKGVASPERVLVVGASGGVGHYAVQIAKALDAEVTAVCSTANIGRVRELGADAVLDYTRGETADAQRVFDRVFDAVSLGTFGRWRRWLRPDGSYVSLLPRADLLFHQLTLRFHSRQRARSILLKPNQADLQRLAGWMAEGKIRTVIDSVYRLEDLRMAFDKSRSGRARGKIIVRVSG